MPKFRKRPVEIEAVQFRGVPDLPFERAHWAAEADWFEEALERGRTTGQGGIWHEGETLAVHTPEGVMTARPGDWIIRGVQGELYPCTPDIFAATYERVWEE